MKMLWLDEDNDLAQAHISVYKKEITELEKKYEDKKRMDQDCEITYEQHMQERRKINQKLKSIHSKFSDATTNASVSEKKQ